MSIRARFSSIDGATYTKWSLHQEESRHARIAPFSLFAESLAFPTTRAWGGVTMVKRALRLDCLNHYVFLRAQKGDVLNLLDASPVMFSGYMMERSTPPEVRDSLSLLLLLAQHQINGGFSWRRVKADLPRFRVHHPSDTGWCSNPSSGWPQQGYRAGSVHVTKEEKRKEGGGKRNENASRGSGTSLPFAPERHQKKQQRGKSRARTALGRKKKSTCSTGAALPLASPLRRDTNEALPNFDL